MKLIALVALLCISSEYPFAQVCKSVPVVQDSSAPVFGQYAEKWIAAYNGTDANALTPLYTDDAQYISGHVAGLVAKGREKVIANFQKGMSMGGHLDGLEVLSVNLSGELATILCKYDANNSGQKVSGLTLLVMKKVGDKWLIAIHMTVV